MIFFTLRKSFLLFFLLLLILSGGLYSAQQYLSSVQKVSYQMSELKEEALEAHVALFEDDYQLITSLQSYIATGNSQYEQAYEKATDISNGKLPRSNGKELDIFDFLEKANIPKEKMDRVNELSDMIGTIEEEVFNTVKGKYKDSDGEYTIQGAPNLARAIQIVHSPEYVKDNEEYRAIIHAFINSYIDQLSVEVDKAEAKAHFAEKIEGVMLLIMLISFILILYWLYKMIVGAIQKSLFIAKQLADSDLTAEISINRNDEIGHLMQAMNGIGDGLNKVVKDVRLSVNKINTASQGIYEDSTHLSAKAEEQAANLEKAASAMEELTSTVKLNADNVKQANDQAAIAADIATEGGMVVSTVVDTMSGIKESSSKIAEIITTIDGIAFQTNILALNAAVEAARAGEQGRGFAVVASEVRTLAQRSAEAAKEISSLITDSVARVEEGAKQVDDAGNMMGKIVDSVKMVATIMKEITTAGHEQSIGIEEINIAVSRMDKMTQQNVTMVEKAAVSAKSLLEQADYLTAAVKVFKMREEGTSSKNSPLLLEQKKAPE